MHTAVPEVVEHLEASFELGSVSHRTSSRAVGKRELVWRKHASGRAIDPHGWESEDGMKIKQSLLKTVP